MVAGLAFHCSQKVHNQLAAVARASEASTYVAILDDDIQLHPSSIGRWVAELEAHPEVFVGSGYSFDWVHPDAMSLPTQLVLMWRMVAMAAFMHERPINVWGGALMFRREGLLGGGAVPLCHAWRDGGYSEDLITIALARKHGLPIAMPLGAIFPNCLSEPFCWARYWNYVCRQVFALCTYSCHYHAFLSLQMQATLLTHAGTCALASGALLALAAGAARAVGGAFAGGAWRAWHAAGGAPAGAAVSEPAAAALRRLAAALLGAGVHDARAAAAELVQPCGRTALLGCVQAAAFLALALVFKVTSAPRSARAPPLGAAHARRRRSPPAAHAPVLSACARVCRPRSCAWPTCATRSLPRRRSRTAAGSACSWATTPWAACCSATGCTAGWRAPPTRAPSAAARSSGRACATPSGAGASAGWSAGTSRASGTRALTTSRSQTRCATPRIRRRSGSSCEQPSLPTAASRRQDRQ